MSTGGGNSRIEIDKFDGSRFDLWKIKMEDLLVDRDFWVAIQKERPVYTVDEAGKCTSVGVSLSDVEAWDKADRKGKGLIRLCLSDSILTNVKEEATALGLWRKLEAIYESKSVVSKILLRKKLYKLKMHESDSFTNHLTTYNSLVGQLASTGDSFSDEDRAITLLCSLPDSWENLIIVIGSSVDKVLSYEDVCSALLAEETRRGGLEKSSKGALAASRSRSSGRDGKAPAGSRSKSRPRSKSRDKKFV